MFGSEILEFTASAQHFIEYGTYTKAYPGSKIWKLHWEEEARRCLYGYHIGSDYIPGYFYDYLNYSPILKVTYDKTSDFNQQDNIQADRIEGFPDFWDGDYKYFHHLNEAEAKGCHAVVVKTRGRGYSFKGGSMLNRNYYHIRQSRSYAIAQEMEFLVKDGILTKAWNIMDFRDEHTPWAKRRHKKNTDIHRRASYLEEVNGVQKEKGFKSEIMGISLKDAPNKARGKRGKLILWEESGENKHLLRAWQIARPSMEQGKATFGLMVAFGTGGSDEQQFAGLEELFYNGSAHNIYMIDNEWDEGMEDTKCGFFMPEYLNMEGYMDQWGNSLIDKAMAQLHKERDNIRKNSKSPTALARHMAEKPMYTQEAFMRIGSNLFPTADLAHWEKQLMTKPELQGFGNVGKLYRTDDGELKFKHTDDKPIYDFPIKKEDSSNKEYIKGSLVMYHPPVKIGGKIPKNVYIICHDPYAQDGSGGSLGAAYVIARPNGYTKPDDCIVASYVARPGSQDEYNRNLFMLAEYYNAKIGFENDRGNVKEYATNHHLLHHLQEEFQILDKKDLQSIRNRGYGMHMTEGRKEQGELYIRDWLLQKRSEEDGKEILNLHLIYDIGLIRELIKFDKKNGNFDRVMALMIGMYLNKELYHAQVEEIKEEEDDFWDRLY